jgi:hypothetical protein
MLPQDVPDAGVVVERLRQSGRLAQDVHRFGEMPWLPARDPHSGERGRLPAHVMEDNGDACSASRQIGQGWNVFNMIL